MLSVFAVSLLLLPGALWAAPAAPRPATRAATAPRATTAPKGKARSAPKGKARSTPKGKVRSAPKKTAKAPKPRSLDQGQLMTVLQRLQHRDTQQRIVALQQLYFYRGKAQVVLVALARALVDTNHTVRFLAARQIIRWGPGALAYMRPALGHPDEETRWSAAYAISQMQPKTAPIRSVLMTLLRNSSHQARGAAIFGLHDGKQVSLRVWRALARQLAWEIHPINRMYCLKALMTRPHKALPLVLKTMFRDKHPLVRRRAAALLVASRLPRPLYLPSLLLALVGEKDEVVQLGFLGFWRQLYHKGQAPAAAIIGPLRRLMKAKLWTLREASVVLAGELGAAGKALLPDLKRARKDPRPEVQTAAATAYQKLSAHAASKPTSAPTKR